MEMLFIQKSLPAYDVPKMSDRHGLNLNITVPASGGNGLPVVAYIHGGGFSFGSGTYSHYDQSKVVELSVIMGQPIIAVNLKYAHPISLVVASLTLFVAIALGFLGFSLPTSCLIAATKPTEVCSTSMLLFNGYISTSKALVEMQAESRSLGRVPVPVSGHI